jgi:hypothetical protein
MTGLPARSGIRTDKIESALQEHDPRYPMWYEMLIQFSNGRPAHQNRPICGVSVLNCAPALG